MDTFIIIFNICNCFFLNGNNLVSCRHFVIIKRAKLAGKVELPLTSLYSRWFIEEYDETSNSTTRRAFLFQSPDAWRNSSNRQLHFGHSPCRMRSNFSGNYTRKDVVGEKSPVRRHVMSLIYKMDGVVNTTHLITLGAKVTHTWIPIAQITDY